MHIRNFTRWDKRCPRQKGALVYILRLKTGKRYVGSTSNYNARMRAHFSGAGAKATRKYAPMYVERRIPCYNASYARKVEQSITKEYIHQYGYSEVRGGCYTNSKTF